MDAFDWSTTELGPQDRWPSSLRTSAGLVLRSHSPMLLWWGPDLVQICNESYRRLGVHRHAQAMGVRARDAWNELWPVVGSLAESVQRDGASTQSEHVLLPTNRRGYVEEAYFTFSFSPVPGDDGEPGGVLVTCQETTDHVLGERRLRTLQAIAPYAVKSRSVEDAARLALKGLAANAHDVPIAQLYLFEQSGSELKRISTVGAEQDVLAFDSPLALAELAKEWSRRDSQQERRPVVMPLRGAKDAPSTANGSSSPTRAAVLPLNGGRGGQLSGLLVAGLSRKLEYDQNYQTFLQLVAMSISAAMQSARAFEQEEEHAESLAEVNRAKTAFFGNVSSGFRTPLTLILGPIEDELAEQDEPLPPGRRARLEIAHRNSLRLLRIVNTLLDFSHIEAGRMQASFEPVDLVAVTEDLAGSFRAPIEKAGLRLSTRLEALPEPVYVDREMWTKIVLNLLSNALKHTFKGGITLSLFASDESKDHVELRVDDTGVGVPEKEIAHLFQRFHKVRGTRSRSDEGTGIGLALVRTLVTLHGGDVAVVSREGVGSTFRVRLRRGVAHLPSERIVSSRKAARDDAHIGGYVDEALQWSKESHGASEGRNLHISDAEELDDSADASRARVLWADGSTDMRNYVARLLSRSYEVEAVASADATLKAALETPPDLIVLDVMLPDRDGLSVLKELRAAERTCLIPVILLSSRAGEDAALEGLDAGADDYLVKPFSGKALLARVRSCLTLAKLRKESADKLAEANKELEAFSYSVSHDLRAPLRAIDGFSQALLNDYASKLDDEGRHYLERVRSGTQRMGQLIDDLLHLSRITRAPLRRERVDLTAIGRKILAELASREPERRVEWQIADGLVAQGDARLVTVLLENLLGNAWKFTSKQPLARIHLQSEVRDRETAFVVRDNGAGFNMQYANKLFVPFQRLHSAKQFQGTGIGLATVHRVVARHGGRVWAESAPNEGATFFFTLGEQA
ncbi:MAG TPA: ATP-binding protein [Polyangiaceae bacterium]|nr:ATP-binding protein [Polyangiaceae bacterium]